MEIGYYTHYKKLANVNGSVNRMTKQDILMKLHKEGLDTCGSRDILKKRLKVFYKNRHLGTSGAITPFQYFCVIDFEATCEANVQNYIHEIIEFPAILVDAVKLEIVDEFHSYCKPIINAQLTDFCKELTGITQEQVENAKPFKEVFSDFEQWLNEHNLLNSVEKSFTLALVTDGPWDICRFLEVQCQLSQINFPNYALKWINLRKAFINFYQPKGKINLECMLQCLGMIFEGRQHCGLHDSRNIVRILLKILQDGAVLNFNEKISIKEEKIEKTRPKKRNQRSETNVVPEIPNAHENLGVDPDFVGQEHILLLAKGISGLLHG